MVLENSKLLFIRIEISIKSELMSSITDRGPWCSPFTNNKLRLANVETSSTDVLRLSFISNSK